MEIRNLGDQGDGIARINRGYVLIVPEIEPGDKIEIEVNQMNSNYGFAHVVGSETDQEPTFKQESLSNLATLTLLEQRHVRPSSKEEFRSTNLRWRQRYA